MSDELRIGIVLSFSKGGAKANRSEHFEVSVTGDAFSHEVQEVGTDEEELAQGADVGTPGYLFIKNMDSTNYVEVGKSTGVYSIKVQAGESAIFRFDGNTIYAKANSAACLVEYIIIET